MFGSYSFGFGLPMTLNLLEPLLGCQAERCICWGYHEQRKVIACFLAKLILYFNDVKNYLDFDQYLGIR